MATHIIPSPADTALPLEGTDFTLHTRSVTIDFNRSAPVGVDVSFLVDSIALEWEESVSLSLVQSGEAPPPTGTGFVFINTVNLTIVDSTGEFRLPASYTVHSSVTFN